MAEPLRDSGRRRRSRRRTASPEPLLRQRRSPAAASAGGCSSSSSLSTWGRREGRLLLLLLLGLLSGRSTTLPTVAADVAAAAAGAEEEEAATAALHDRFRAHVARATERFQPGLRRQLLQDALAAHLEGALQQQRRRRRQSDEGADEAVDPRRGSSSSSGDAHRLETLSDEELLLRVQRFFSAYAAAARHRGAPSAPAARSGAGRAPPPHPPLDRARSLAAGLPPFPPSLAAAARDRLRQAFAHAYDAYLVRAFPAPELRPLTCGPGRFGLVPLDGLTLVDALDTLVVLGNWTEFARAAERLRRLWRGDDSDGGLFGVDQNVSLFETNIRVVGGLLSAHQLAQAFLSNRVPWDAVLDDDDGVRWGYAESGDEAECRWRPDDRCTRNIEEERQEFDIETVMRDDVTPSPCTDDSDPLDGTSSSTLSNTVLFQGTCRLDQRRRRARTSNTTAASSSASETCSARYWVYDGFLLDMAIDIGTRLFPAFHTKTGIPYGTVNLQYGVPPGETTIASLAGGGTLTLEMELLSRLSGDDRFGKAAKLASRALFVRKSPLGLFGKHIDIQSGHWTETLSGIGSNSDSFFEYLVKHYILFPQDKDFWTMFQSAYTGVHNHSRAGEWYPDVDMNAGLRGHARQVLESLMAFYPGMQVLLGELTPAARTLNSMFIVREMLGFLPERFHFGLWKPDVGRGAANYPLRPELLESCYFLHRATKDMTPSWHGTLSTSAWQWAAEFALRKLETMTRVDCGHASIHSISTPTTGAPQVPFSKELLYDEMPSFFLSETIKYLYLIFDDDNILHTDDDHEWIFTTEAHPIHSVPKLEPSKDLSDYMAQQVEALKNLLKGRLHHASRQQNKANSFVNDFWGERTSSQAYSKDLRRIETDIKKQTRERNASDFYFDAPLVVPFIPAEFIGNNLDMDLVLDRNLAHVAMNNQGMGNGLLLRKACPSIYASELLWLHALSGGALDYTETYVTVGSDNLLEHPYSFHALGAVEALGALGSGLLFAGRHNGPLGTCPIQVQASGPESDTDASSTADSNSANPASKLVKLKSSIGEFEVETYPSGEGFYIHHIDSGETLMTTFLFDKSSTGHDLVMVYSAFGRRAHGETKTEDAKISQWVRMRSKLHTLMRGDASAENNNWSMQQDMRDMDERKVAVSDFNGNSFYCEVVVLEKIASHSSDPESLVTEDEDEEILGSYPCAPALFGPTSFEALLRSDGICLEKPAYAPTEFDETGCVRVPDTPTDFHRDELMDYVPSIVRDGCDPDAPGPCGQGNAIRIVRRGDCGFYSKAVNQRLRWAATGVIVINDEDSDLFVMSSSDDGEILLSPEEVPCSVLVNSRDGEDLLSKLDVDRDEAGAEVVVRITLSPQPAGLPLTGAVDGAQWPIVAAQANLLHVYSRAGWGVQAARNAPFGGGWSSEWNLQLIKHGIVDRSDAATAAAAAAEEADP